MVIIIAIYRSLLVAVRNTAIGSHWGGGGGGGGGAVIRMFDKTPATEKIPKLHPHGALNRAYTVIPLSPIITAICRSASLICLSSIQFAGQCDNPPYINQGQIFAAKPAICLSETVITLEQGSARFAVSTPG